jgi:HK97 family phage prohead protease/HK97 family phage major capsid protein
MTDPIKRALAKQDAPDPDEDESHGEFIDRCVSEMTSEDDSLDESDAEEMCQIAWEDTRAARDVVHKTHASEVNGSTFVLSDQSVDRMGDIIMADGWKLSNFKRNPIALGFHRSDFPIGTWKNLRVDGTELRGELELAPEGTSPRIDEIRRLVDAKVLRAVSVGFRPIKHEPLDPKDVWSGERFLEQELVECSLVSVPANANAIAVAKSLQISSETMDVVFAEHGKRDAVQRRGFTGKHAELHRRKERGSAMSLNQRINDVQVALVAKQDALAELVEKMDDSNVSDAEFEANNKLNADISRLQKTLDLLVETERNTARKTAAEDGNGTRSRALSTTVLQSVDDKAPRGAPIILPGGRKKDFEPLDLYVRAGTVAVRAKEWAVSTEAARTKIYGDDIATKEACDIVLRAASAPAMTTVTGWAAELVQPRYEGLLPLLMPKAILTRLAPRGLALDFGGAGKIVIPMRSRTPTIAGSFVGEGLPIPVRQGAFTSQTLTPKKVAVISVWTREMDLYSTPAIEGVIREAIQDDTTVAVDSVLLDANAATAVRPAGILNGVAALTATAGGGVAGIVGDIKQLVNAITVATYGNVRNLVWLMNPSDILSASLISAASTGVFPFKEEIARGTLATVPIIDSSTVPAKTVILMDAADFVSVGGGAPRFEMSDSATLHLEDTAPAELVAAGSPGVVAAPQRSLFQTDSLALRMVMPLNWAQRRPGTVAWVQNVTW